MPTSQKHLKGEQVSFALLLLEMPELHLYYSTSHRESMEYGPITALGQEAERRSEIGSSIKPEGLPLVINCGAPDTERGGKNHLLTPSKGAQPCEPWASASRTMIRYNSTVLSPQLTVIPSHHVLVHKMSRNVDFRPQCLRHIKDRAASSRSRIYWWNPVSLSSSWMSWSLT